MHHRSSLMCSRGTVGSCEGCCRGLAGNCVGLVDYALHYVLLFEVEICGEGFVELGLFVLKFCFVSVHNLDSGDRNLLVKAAQNS
jgi:hypothetical protein